MHMPTISRIPLTLAFAISAILVLVGAASASSPVVHRASVGTPDACEAFAGSHPGCDANYSWTAIAHADGSASGQYTDSIGHSFTLHGTIDCLAVDGNRAWVSGQITGGFAAGEFFSSSAQDNGTSAKDPADQISRTLISDVPFNCLTMDDVVLGDVPQGQVTVR